MVFSHAVCFSDEESREISTATISLSTAQIPVWSRDEHSYRTTLAHLHHVTDVGGGSDMVDLHQTRVGKTILLSFNEGLAVWCDLDPMSDRETGLVGVIVVRRVLKEHLTGKIVEATFGEIEPLVILCEVDSSIHNVMESIAFPFCYVCCGENYSIITQYLCSNFSLKFKAI